MAETSGTKKTANPKVQPLAQNHAEAAVKALVAVMQDETAPPAARITAAHTLLQWGYGKPGAAVPAEKTEKPTEQVIRLCWGQEPA
jgi:hypothetical protein